MRLIGRPVPDRSTRSLRSLAPGRPRAAPHDRACWRSLRSRGSCAFSAALCPTARLGRCAPSLPAGRGRRRMTTKLFGEPIPRREDPRLVSGNGRYLDDLGGDALAAAFVRSPYAHARIVDVDVTDALDVDGLVAIYTYEDLDGRVAEPLPLLIPHPALRAPRTGYPLA